VAYRIQSSESAEAALQRLILDQNRKSLTLLRDWHKNPTDRIHRSRQCFRRTRAVLRLIKSDAPYVYEIENRFYRDLARTLADARDADAMVEAIEFLERRFSDDSTVDSLEMLKTSLMRRAQADLECSIVDVAAKCRAAAIELQRADRRFHRLPVHGIRKKQLKRSVSKAMRSCEKAYKKARRTECEDDFHAWRKRVKCAYYHSRLVRDISPGWSENYLVPLKELAEILGERQDLYVLDQFLASQPDGLEIDIHVRKIRNMIASAQGALKIQALNLGECLFRSRAARGRGRSPRLQPRTVSGGRP
jgi:CHAD domain-containing protein